MPYPNEHACRLEDPDKYDRFNRVNCDQKHDGKCIDVIYGIKEGKSEIQALRYKKDVWSASDARKHCKSRGGNFEPAKKEQSAGLDLILDQPWLIQKESLENLTQVNFLPLFDDMTEDSHLRFIKDVAVIDIVGPIFRYSNIFTMLGLGVSVEQLASDLEQALTKNDIALNINSPGGQADGINDFAEAIYKAREDHNVKCFVSGVAASAAYWIASAADKVVVSETAIVGSIGTAIVVRKKQDTDELEFVSSQSPRKRPDPETDEGKKDIVKILDDLTEVFINKVARNRNTTPEIVKSSFGQGGVFVGSKAVDNGMVDETGLNFVGGSSMAITAKYVRENHPEIVTELTSEKDAEIEQLNSKIDELNNRIDELEGDEGVRDDLPEEVANKLSEQDQKITSLEKDNLTLKLASIVGEDLSGKLANFAGYGIPHENIFGVAQTIAGLQKTIDDLGSPRGSNEAEFDDSDKKLKEKAEKLAQEKGISIVDAYTELVKEA